MKILDYNKSTFDTISLEHNTLHRKQTKYVYQYNYNGNFIGTQGVSSRVKNGKIIRDTLPLIFEQYNNNNKVKLYTTSVKLFNHEERDSLYKQAIGKGKILVTAYGNTDTGVFPQAKNENWINVIGVEKHFNKYKPRNYVANLSEINKYTFAVDRSEEDSTLHGFLKGTSFDQPYFSKIVNKILSYCDEKGYDLNRDKLLEILCKISTKINLNGFKVHLLSQRINLNKINKFLEVKTMKDVEKTKWSYKAINYVVEKGFMKGYEDGSFKPEKAVTREELAQVLYNIEVKKN